MVDLQSRNKLEKMVSFLVTVTNGDVAEAIEAATKKDIDRRDITVPDIHNLGSFVAKIKLHKEVSAEVNIEVTS